MRRRLHVPLDVGFPDHPKIRPLDSDSFRVHVTALCYAKKYQTDGIIPEAAAKGFGATLPSGFGTVRRLLSAGLWKKVRGGYEILGFLDHNPSRAQILAGKAAMSEGARLTNENRWGGQQALKAGVLSPTRSPTRSGTRTEVEVEVESSTSTEKGGAR